MIMRAVSATSGEVIFRGGGEEVDVLKLEGEALRRFRPRMQMVFQDPASSLSPRMTVATSCASRSTSMPWAMLSRATGGWRT